MTITALSRVVEYLGDGATVTFSVPFQFFGTAEIEVALRDAGGAEAIETLSTHYSVTGGGGASGSVTFVAAPSTGLAVVIRGKTARSQLTTYVADDAFPAASHQDALDRRAAVDIEQDDVIEDVRSRAPLVPPGETAPTIDSLADADGDVLYAMGGRIVRFAKSLLAGKFLGGDALGRPVALSGTGADAALRSDLADPDAGPSLITYLGTSTAQDEFERGRAQAQAQVLWALIEADTADTAELFISDSTADATDEMAYQKALWRASKMPHRTVVYSLFDYDNGVWGTPEVIQTGVGGNGHTHYFDNCAKAGKNVFMIEGAREALIFGRGRFYNEIQINHGHNHGVLSTAAILTPPFKMTLANVMLLQPSARVFATLQNPDTQYPNFTKQHVAAWLASATRFGSGIHDNYHLNWDFDVDYPAPGPHPTGAAEQAKIIPEMKRTFSEVTPWSRAGTHLPSPLMVPRKSLIPNPSFAAWPAGASAPTNWNPTNCTLAKDPGRKRAGAKYSMKVTPTGITPKVTMNLGFLLPMLKGRKLAIAADVWVQSGMAGDLSGRIDLSSLNGVTSVPATSTNRAAEYSKDGWYRPYAELEVQSDATSLNLTYYAGESSGADTLPSWVQFFGVVDGDMPFRIDLSDHATLATIEQYFAPGNVHLPNAVAGSLTTATDGFTLTGAATGVAKTIIELSGLEVGRTYTFSGNMVSYSGGAGGAFYVTASSGGGGGNVAVSAPLAVGTNSVSFVATSQAQSVLVWTNSSGTGYVFDTCSITDTYTGITVPNALALTSARNPNGSVVDATGGSGLFKVLSTPGTSLVLLGEAANSGGTPTTTSNVLWEVALPASYIAGKNITVTVNAQLTGAGTAGTKTLDVIAYEVATAGTEGSDLGPATQNLTTSAAHYSFTINGAALAAGDRLIFETRSVVQSTTASDLQAQINSVRVS